VSDIPEWLATLEPWATSNIDKVAKRITIDCNGRAGEIAFGQVPKDWAIHLENLGRGYEAAVTCKRQAANVSWHLARPGGNLIRFGTQISNIYVHPDRHNRIHLELARNRTRLTLADGAYQLDGSRKGLPLSLEVHWLEDAAFTAHVDGEAKIARLVGPSAGRITVTNLAECASITGSGGEMILASDVRSPNIASTGRVLIDGVLSGSVAVKVTEFVVTGVRAEGVLEADTLESCGSIVGVGAGLDVAIQTRLSVANELENVTVTGSDLSRVAECTVGLADPRTVVSVSGFDVDSAWPIESLRISTSRATNLAKVKEASFLGRLSVGFAGPAQDVYFDIAGRVTAAHEVSLARPHPSGRPSHVGAIYVRGTLDLGGGTLNFDSIAAAQVLKEGSLTCHARNGAVHMRHVQKVRIEADLVALAGSQNGEPTVVASSVWGRSVVKVEHDVDSASVIEAFGNATLSGDVAGRVRWLPSGGDHSEHELTVGGRVHSLRAVPVAVEARAVLKLGSQAHVGTLDCMGPIELDCSGDEAPVGHLTMNEGSAVTLRAPAVKIGRVAISGDARFVAVSREAGHRITLGLVAQSGQASASLESAGATFLVQPWPAEGDPDQPGPMPRLAIHGGAIVIGGDVPALDAFNGPGSVAPTVSVLEEGRLRNVWGGFALLGLDGRIDAGFRQSGGVKDPKPSRAFLTKIFPLAVSDGSTRSAKSGQLNGVDISRISSADVANLARIQVLTPPGRQLIDYAKDLGPKGPRARLERAGKPRDRKVPFSRQGPHDNLRAEAQKLREIADILRERANSGATYSAAEWAAAHAHALAFRRPRIEVVLRTLHRCVGYGVRPGPALLTLAMWIWGMATLLWARDSQDPGGAAWAAFRGGGYDYLQSLGRAILLPAGLLRSDVGGADPYRPAFEDPFWHFVFVLATGLIVGFVAVALKNYLLRPKTDR